MSHSELTERLLSSEASINGHDITAGTISEHQMFLLSQRAEDLSRNRLFYLDNKYSIADITAKARLAYRKHGVRFVVADYLQLVDAESKRGMLREQAVSSVSRELKRLAMELKIPVLVLSQLNREVEKRDDKRPKLSDIRERMKRLRVDLRPMYQRCDGVTETMDAEDYRDHHGTRAAILQAS